MKGFKILSCRVAVNRFFIFSYYWLSSAQCPIYMSWMSWMSSIFKKCSHGKKVNTPSKLNATMPLEALYDFL